MPYVITKSDGSVFTTINDATLDINTNLTFTGRNYSGYGEFVNQNFFTLLENFSNNVAPTKPVQGQLWFDKTVANNPRLKICYDGKHFKNVVSVPLYDQYHSPSNPVDGDLWYVSDLNQLRVYINGAWTSPANMGGTASSTYQLVPGPKPTFVTTSTGLMAVSDGTWGPNTGTNLMIYLNDGWRAVTVSGSY
jgi:hypothetical protein